MSFNKEIMNKLLFFITVFLFLSLPSTCLSKDRFLGVKGRGYFSLQGFVVDNGVEGIGSPDDSLDASLKLTGAKYRFREGLGTSLAVGFDFENPWRVEFEYSLRVVQITEITFGSDIRTFGTLTSHAILFNGFYDFKPIYKFSAYTGAGLGWSLHNGDRTLRRVNDDNGLAYQLIAGIDYPLWKNVELGLIYKYFATEDVIFGTSRNTSTNVTTPIDFENDSHNFGIGVKYYWGKPSKKKKIFPRNGLTRR